MCVGGGGGEQGGGGKERRKQQLANYQSILALSIPPSQFIKKGFKKTEKVQTECVVTAVSIDAKLSIHLFLNRPSVTSYQGAAALVIYERVGPSRSWPTDSLGEWRQSHRRASSKHWQLLLLFYLHGAAAAKNGLRR